MVFVSVYGVGGWVCGVGVWFWWCVGGFGSEWLMCRIFQKPTAADDTRVMCRAFGSIFQNS